MCIYIYRQFNHSNYHTDTGKILKVVFVGTGADTNPVIAEEITVGFPIHLNEPARLYLTNQF